MAETTTQLDRDLELLWVLVRLAGVDEVYARALHRVEQAARFGEGELE